ncbi:hypothetical protein JCM11251_007993 [Rhodosporidiobolus azoricus]
MELRTAASDYHSVSGEDHGDETEHQRSSSTRRRGISGSLEALRSTRNGKATEWVAIRYPTRDDFSHLWECIKNPASRARGTKVPLARAVTAVLYGVGALVLVALGISGVIGYFKYRSLFHPHHAKHASKADLKSGNVVKPFFAPDANGLVDQFNVGVSIWFREGNLTMPNYEELGRGDNGGVIRYSYGPHSNEASPYQLARDLYWMGQNSRVDGEDGFVRNETKQNPWEEVWTAEVATDGLARTTSRSLDVTLPGRIVHSLVVNPLSRLVATFTVYPATLNLHSLASSELAHTSSRPVDKFGSNMPWPMASIPSALKASPAVLSFLKNAAVGYDIKNERQVRWTGHWDDPDNRDNLIFSRTWLTMAKDYPVYEQASFKSALEGLRQDKDGHFENLLDVDGKQHYYGPFLTTRMTSTTPSDRHILPPYSVMNSTRPELVKDFQYPWTFTFSPISPAKLALTDKLADTNDQIWRGSWSERETARQHDRLEVYNALLGQSFNPNAHPIARTVLGGFAILLRYLTVPLIFHYWLTRRTTTGLVIALWFAQSVSDIVFHIVHSLTNQHYFNLFPFRLKLFGFILIGLVQLRLLTGIEVRFAHLLPAAVRIRGSTPGERKSAEADRRLDWRLRLGAFLVLFLSLRLAPAVPPLIRATLNTTEDPLIRLYWRDDQSPLALLWLRNLSSWSSATWLLVRVSQIHLNYRQGTFAAFHPVTSYLLFTSLLVTHITTIFSSFFGRAQSQGPLTAWDLVTLIIEATLAVQARMLPVVNQREDMEHLG